MRADRPFFKASPFGESIAAFKSWESVPWADMTDTDYVGESRIKREEKGQVKGRKKRSKSLVIISYRNHWRYSVSRALTAHA